VRIILATGYAELPGDSRVDVPKLNKPFTQTDLARVLTLTDAGRREINTPAQRLRLV
jgi:hypothetical protein